METSNMSNHPDDVISDSKGYSLVREVCLLSFLGVGFLLNLFALIALKQIIQKKGHYVIVMGLVSSNVVSNFTLLTLIPFTVRNIHNQVLFITMFPLSLSTYLVSVIHVVCISIERLVAVAKPTSYQKLFSCKRMKITVFGVWFIALSSHAIIVFLNVNVYELVSVRYLRFVMFRPYLLFYYTTGLAITVAVYIILLICLGCKMTFVHQKVAPSNHSSQSNSAFNTNTSGSRFQGNLMMETNHRTEGKYGLDVISEEVVKQTSSNSDDDESSHPLNQSNNVNDDDDGNSNCLADSVLSKEIPTRGHTENLENQGREEKTKKSVLFFYQGKQRVQKQSDSSVAEYMPPIPGKPEYGRQDISITDVVENSNATSVTSTTMNRVYIRKLREPKAVITIGVLLLIHLLTGVATLVSYGVIGENALSHSKLFGLPVFMIAINSLFDPFFYVVSSVEVRKAVKEIFSCAGPEDF